MGHPKGRARLSLPPSFLDDFTSWLDRQDAKASRTGPRHRSGLSADKVRSGASPRTPTGAAESPALPVQGKLDDDRGERSAGGASGSEATEGLETSTSTRRSEVSLDADTDGRSSCSEFSRLEESEAASERSEEEGAGSAEESLGPSDGDWTAAAAEDLAALEFVQRKSPGAPDPEQQESPAPSECDWMLEAAEDMAVLKLAQRKRQPAPPPVQQQGDGMTECARATDAEEDAEEEEEEEEEEEDEVLSSADAAVEPEADADEEAEEVLDATLASSSSSSQQESRQRRFEFKEADYSNFMEWLDDLEARSDCVESDPGDPGFICSYFEEDFGPDRTTSEGSESVLSYKDELEQEQEQGQAIDSEELEAPPEAAAAESEEAGPPAERARQECRAAAPPEEPSHPPEGNGRTASAEAVQGLVGASPSGAGAPRAACGGPDSATEDGGARSLPADSEEPWRPPEGDWLTECAEAFERQEAAGRSPGGPQADRSGPAPAAEDAGPRGLQAGSEESFHVPEGDWEEVVEAMAALEEQKSPQGRRGQLGSQAALGAAGGRPGPPGRPRASGAAADAGTAPRPAEPSGSGAEPVPIGPPVGERSAPSEGRRPAAQQPADAAAAKASPSSGAQGGKRPLPSPPDGEDASVKKWNPYDSKLYTFEEFVEACRGSYSDQRVLAFWRNECKPLEAKKPRQTSSEAAQAKADRSRSYPAPPSRSGADVMDWSLVPPRNSEHLQRRNDLVELELQLALGTWATTSGAPRGRDMMKALAALDVRDLQGLRREVNCRILPDAKRAEKKQKRKPAGRGARAAAAAEVVEPFPLPREEHSLISLSESILELERLKQLVYAHLPYEHEYTEVLFRMLSGNVESVFSFAFKRADFDWSDLGPEIEEAVLKMEEEAVSQANEDDLERIARRSEMVTHGHSPIIVTAPHNVFLRRDGCTPHMREDYTTFIAQRLAAELEGTCLCWTRLEQWRTETRYALGHRHIAAGAASTNEALDPTNRDPNFLSVEELYTNPWHCGLKEWFCQRRREKKLFQLHIDVHGCQNPPVYPTHMVLGLGAMRRRIEEMSDGPKRRAELRRLLAFADLLQEKLGPAVAPMTGLSPSEIVTVTGLGPEAGYSAAQDFLTGVAVDPERRTLTQQSVLHIGVSHGLQCEFSFRLRKLLLGEPRAIDCLARALRSCWREASEVGIGKPDGLGTRR